LCFFTPTLTSSTWYVALFLFLTNSTTTEFYTLSLHDALPILRIAIPRAWKRCRKRPVISISSAANSPIRPCASAVSTTSPTRRRSEEHTSELQSRFDLVCRLLLEKKKKIGRDYCR